MSFSELRLIMPLVCLAAAAVVLMLAIGVRRHHGAAVLVTLAGLAAALATLPDISTGRALRVTPLLMVDRPGIFYLALFFAAGIVTTLLAHGYLQRYDGRREEFYLLLLAAVLGAALLAISSHFASLFLGLEILSVSLYSLIAYPHRTAAQVEAGLKYLILAGTSSAFLLFGMAMFYAGSGSMAIDSVAGFLRQPGLAPDSRWLVAGAAMLLVAVGFKLALVPFHLWAADVYQGAPPPAAAFVATVSKGAVVALLMRLFPPGELTAAFYISLAALAAASMVAGNLLALLQRNVKRILAYSSVAHMGYLMVAFLAGRPPAAAAVAFYLVAYFVMTLGAFGVLSLLSTPDQDVETLEDFRGLFWRRPWQAGIFALMLFSLAGLPLTVGFLGKFYLVAAGVAGAQWVLVATLVLTSGIGLFYYLRVIAAMTAQPPRRAERLTSLPLAGALTVAGLAVVLIWLGILPGPLMGMIGALM